MTRRVQLGSCSVDVPHSRIDALIERVAPQWGARRLQSRIGTALATSMSVGGYHGGDTSRRSMAGWGARLLDADGANLPQLQNLRAHSADLIRNSPIAGGAVETAVLNVVGTGLAMNSRIAADVLGMTDAQATAWQDKAQAEFELWCEATDCDVERQTNFYGKQTQAFFGVLEQGDMLVSTPSIERESNPYRLAINLTPGPRVCNPAGKRNDAKLVDGVEKSANGEHVAYHVASRHPGSILINAGKVTWARVPARGDRDRRNAWLLRDHKRVASTRGTPWLAPVIEPLKQMERYTEAELMAAVVSGMFTVFIKSEAGPDVSAVAGVGTSESAGSGSGWDGRLGNGVAVDLGDGESIETANPGRPNAQFDPFIQAIIRQIGARLQIPFEVLLKFYQSSYSASKAAMLDAWRFFKERRAWLVREFCQPIYELWLDEAVAAGRIDAPGYFADPLIRRAYARAEWIGDGMGTIDPLKDVQAARERVALEISTLESESLAYDGIPWSDKHAQRSRELRAQRADGTVETVGAAPVGQIVQDPADPGAGNG